MKVISYTRDTNGFSLLEMAISLTVIALIIAALTVSQQIKTRLQLQQVIDDRSLLETGITSFEEAYTAIPGDFWNATGSFGAENTHNGDGDNVFDEDVGGYDERLLFWQHLQLAGMIEGSYDGVTDGKGGRMAAPLNKGYYRADNADIWGDTGDTIYIVAEKAAGGGLFSVAQAYDYDSKYDDSSPLTGNIRGGEADGASEICLTSGGEYDLSQQEDEVCRMYFLR